MAEQWLKGFAIDRCELDAVVGSNDDALIGRIVASAEDIAELIERGERTAESCAAELIRGALDPDNAYAYRRLLEAVAEVAGRSMESWEAVMPGRGWQDLGPAWAAWDQPAMAAIWGRASSWPWPAASSAPEVTWPIGTIADREEVASLREQLGRFDPGIVLRRGVPASIPRFGDPDHWPPIDLAVELRELVAVIRAMATDAGADAELLLWLDGGQ
jgi:hypothetical protein